MEAVGMVRGPLPEQHETDSPAPSAKALSRLRPPLQTHHGVPKAARRSMRSPWTIRTVRGFDMTGSTWYAATNDGLFVSVDHGHRWYGGMIEAKATS